MANTKKPRALFIGPYPPPFAGPEVGMKLFLESSLQDDFDIAFLCTNVRKSNTSKGRVGGSMIQAFFRFFGQLTWMLIRYRPAIVYYPITATQLGWIGRDVWCILLSRLFRAKVVIHLRASHFRLNYGQFSRWAATVVRFACRRVQLALVQAEYLVEQFEGLVPSDRITCLYQAIEADEYKNDDLDDYEQGKILFMGHLSQAKGYCDLLAALPEVIKRHPDAQFYVAGTRLDGEYNVFFNQLTGEPLPEDDPREREAAIRASSVSAHYHDLGVIQDEAKLAQLRSADIFVLPSYSEGFSRAVVEAMCAGKPVVYTPVGAHREVFEDGREGYRIAPGDVEALTDAICRLLEDRQIRDRMAAYNYKSTRERFDIKIIAQQFSELLKMVLK